MRIQIGYGQIDPSAKPDSIPTSIDIQPWINLDDLKIDGLAVKSVATCEHNQAILDGTQEHLPDQPELYTWGFWSLSMSDESGLFDVLPTLDIGFTFNHKSPGLTLLFYPHSEDWANEVRGTWYDSGGAVLKSGTYQINGIEGNILENVMNFRRIKLEFLSTNIRHRYIKLAGINYGTGRSFQDSDIDTASILEEVDPTSNEITINTLNFRIKTRNPEYSLVSGLGDDMLMRNQQMTIIADEREFGTFFLQFPWKDVYSDGTVIDFQAIDAIGVMDKYQFWGDIYVNTSIEAIISKLFAICFPTQLIRYQIDSIFAGKHVSGWIPTCTCREALQLVCFAIGAVADDSRRDYVWIYPRDETVDHIIPGNAIYRIPSVEPTTYYSGVDVIAYEYVPSGEIVEAHNGTLTIGRHTIKFNEPLYNLTISGGALVEQSANHAIVNVTTAGAVILSGNRYIVNTSVYRAEDEEIEAGEVESVKTYNGCTMLSPSGAQGIANSLFRYLQQRTQFVGDVRLLDNEPGYMVQVPMLKGYPINGTIEQLDINLRGSRARMKVIGDVSMDSASI